MSDMDGMIKDEDMQSPATKVPEGTLPAQVSLQIHWGLSKGMSDMDGMIKDEDMESVRGHITIVSAISL